ncbi:MAG: type II secretion system protein GspG [Pseudomonadota bacterium]
MKKLPKDPWGREYLYLSPGENSAVDIYTLGRDGAPGGESFDADIANYNL